MSSLQHFITFLIACMLASGCSHRTEQPPNIDRPYKFLGIAEDESSNEGPVGLIGGQSIRVSTISTVREVPLTEYNKAIADSRVVAEEKVNGFVYWAIEEQRDVPFENASAWVTVLERYKSRLN